MDELDDNVVPESTVANANGGAERLDADSISTSTLDAIDSLLDQAEANATASEPAPDPKPESGTESVSEVQPETPATPAIEIDPEIAAIDHPRNLSEKNQNNWRKLQETASIYKQQAAEAEVLRQRLAEAESRPPQAPQDYDELRKFRAIFDIKNDPEFKSKYTSNIESAKQSVYSILKNTARLRR